MVKSKELFSNINFAEVLTITSMILPQIIWLQNLAFHQFEIFLIYSVLEAFEGKELKILEPINLIYEKLQILYVLLKYNAPTFDFGSRNLYHVP